MPVISARFVIVFATRTMDLGSATDSLGAALLASPLPWIDVAARLRHEVHPSADEHSARETTEQRRIRCHVAVGDHRATVGVPVHSSPTTCVMGPLRMLKMDRPWPSIRVFGSVSSIP